MYARDFFRWTQSHIPEEFIFKHIVAFSYHLNKCYSYSTNYGKLSFEDSKSRRSVKGATINGVTYEGVADFIHLGTLISNENSMEKEIKRRILAGNRTYFATMSLFRS